jgi:hypothetical protein
VERNAVAAGRDARGQIARCGGWNEAAGFIAQEEAGAIEEHRFASTSDPEPSTRIAA